MASSPDYSLLIAAGAYQSSKQIILKQVTQWLNDLPVKYGFNPGCFYKISLSCTLEKPERDAEQNGYDPEEGEWICTTCGTANNWSGTCCRLCSATGPHRGMTVPSVLLSTMSIGDELPPGFPEAPLKVGRFKGDPRVDTEAYKDHMKKKLKYQLWLNGLTAYRIRLKEKNMEACNQIIEQLKSNLNERQSRMITKSATTSKSSKTSKESDNAKDHPHPHPSKFVAKSLPASTPPATPHMSLPSFDIPTPPPADLEITKEMLYEIINSHESKKHELDYFHVIKRGVDSLVKSVLQLNLARKEQSAKYTEGAEDEKLAEMLQTVVPDLKELLHCLESGVVEELMDQALNFTLSCGELISICVDFTLRNLDNYIDEDHMKECLMEKKEFYDKAVHEFELATEQRDKDKIIRYEAAKFILNETEKQRRMMDLLKTLNHSIDLLLHQTKDFNSKEQVTQSVKQSRDILAKLTTEELKSPSEDLFMQASRELLSASLRIIKALGNKEPTSENELIEALEIFEDSQIAYEEEIKAKSEKRIKFEEIIKKYCVQQENITPEQQFWRSSIHLNKIDAFFNVIHDLEEYQQSSPEKKKPKRDWPPINRNSGLQAKRKPQVNRAQTDKSPQPELSREFEVPDGFPPPPSSDKSYAQWASALSQYRIKLEEGDALSCQKIIEQLIMDYSKSKKEDKKGKSRAHLVKQRSMSHLRNASPKILKISVDKMKEGHKEKKEFRKLDSSPALRTPMQSSELSTNPEIPTPPFPATPTQTPKNKKDKGVEKIDLQIISGEKKKNDKTISIDSQQSFEEKQDRRLKWREPDSARRRAKSARVELEMIKK